MSVFFADTSALAKRYVSETGSAWVRRWARPGHGNIVVISEVTIVELASALARLQRDGSLSPTAFLRLRNSFLVHTEREYLLVALRRRLLLRASRLVVSHPLRALDAIQLVCALEAVQAFGTTPTFVSADRNLLTAAAAEGLPTDDPNLHP